MRIVLASKSPRRRELLGRIIPDFEIITRETDETLLSGVHPRDGVEILAVRKGRAVADALFDDALVISSDTLVELGGVPLGKPTDEDDAVKMLLSLSGKSHNVHTGVAVHYKGRVFSGVDSSAVTFRVFGEAEAREYVATGEPMDKAGAYAIQGIGGKLVEKYEGEFDTIVGLGLKLTKKLIEQAKEYDQE
ncbi:MAG: septum formation protein Maf [Ruminococcaceae bacterium]|nr:septum formation protein Maf [Oscillospiraceae bacterium]